MDWVAVGSIAAVVSAGAAVYAVLENRKGRDDAPRPVDDTGRKPKNLPASLPLDPPPPRGITWAEVANRRIKIATGGRTQSVNASTDENIDGVYEWVVRLE